MSEKYCNDMNLSKVHDRGLITYKAIKNKDKVVKLTKATIIS